jgi:hypothetical protein
MIVHIVGYVECAFNVADVETIVSGANEGKTRRKTDAGVSRSKKGGKSMYCR